jgi:proteasome lid subunit RPN8/RPN11
MGVFTITKVVRLPFSVYKEFLKFSLMYAHPDDHPYWREVIGYLYGHLNIDEPEVLEITDVDQMNAGHAVTVEVPASDTSFYERVEKQEYIVGWIHSHPSFGLFLSSTDIGTQHLFERLFSDAVALVIDPTLITPQFCGIKAFKLDQTGNFCELALEITDSDSADFLELKNTVIQEIPRKRLETQIYETNTVKLQLKALNTTGNLIGLYYSVKDDTLQDFKLKITYQAKTREATLISPLFSKRIDQFVDKEGLIAVFRLEQLGVDRGFSLSLKDLELNVAGHIYQTNNLEIFLV